MAEFTAVGDRISAVGQAEAGEDPLVHQVGAEEEVFPGVEAAREAAAQAEAGDMKPKTFISKIDEGNIVASIAEAEKNTSGEIRVYISGKRRDDALTAAKNRFEKLGMTKTRARNGVLIYVAPASQKFAVVGDIGIHEKCGQDFWSEISAAMAALFKQGRFSDGIVHAVQKAGAALAKHFPQSPGDTNELPNNILGN